VETPVTAPEAPAQDAVLPKYYTVGTWPPDCFWDIAEFVYGDPFRWPIIYEANRDKLEYPDNPDLLEAGTVLEIPSINGERREGHFIR
jgi:nucleoid-associated protein YgaU